MRAVVIVASLCLAACGGTSAGATRHAAGPATPVGVAIGHQVYAVDQLAPAPSDGSGARLLYAVIRVTTSDPTHTIRASFFTLVDAAGRVESPVSPTVYAPIDHLDGLTITPGRPGAGVVAFVLPSAPAEEIRVDDGGSTGELHAP